VSRGAASPGCGATSTPTGPGPAGGPATTCTVRAPPSPD
jgi:hypothetical protein